MFIVHVFVHVEPEHIETFKKATIENAENSVKEPGIARFDVIQEIDDPAWFVLVEVYRSQEDVAKHKDTMHYHKWTETVAGILAEPRTRIKYANVFPDQHGRE